MYAGSSTVPTLALEFRRGCVPVRFFSRGIGKSIAVMAVVAATRYRPLQSSSVLIARDLLQLGSAVRNALSPL